VRRYDDEGGEEKDDIDIVNTYNKGSGYRM
jgi:hypothetical protein